MAMALEIFATVMIGGLAVALALREAYRALRRAVERRQLRRLQTSQYRLTESRGPSHVALVGVAIAQLLFLVLAQAFGRDHALVESMGIVLALLCLAFAFGAHGLPRHDRTAKYVALCLGAFLLQLVVMASKRDVSVQALWGFAIFPAALLGAAVLSRVLRDARWPQERTGLLAFAIHRITMVLGPASGLRAFFTFLALRTGGGLPGYLMLRYYLRPYVSRRPFLYLRSFADHSARRFYGQLLARSAGSRGVVVGLIHEHQTGEELHRGTDSAWYAETFALPNSAWQTWVKDKLGSCTGAVIDMSITTTNVAWEFEQARQRLPLDRVLVVSRHPVPDEVAATGVKILTYSLESRAQQRRAAAALLAWTDGAIRSSLRADAAERPMISVRASLFPIAALAILLWVGFSVVIAFVEGGLIARAASDPTFAPASLLRIAQTWGVRQQVVQVISAAFLLAASPLFPLEGLSAARASRLWLALPCAVVALAGLIEAWLGPGLGAVIVDAIAGQVFLFGMGYILVSCTCAYVQQAAEVKLDTVVLALLAPMVIDFAWTALVPAAIFSRVPAMAWIGACLAAATRCIAAYTFLTFIRGATRLRAEGHRPASSQADDDGRALLAAGRLSG